MNREEVIATLRTLEPELRASGIRSLSLFGSIARNSAAPFSDVDIAVKVGEGFSRRGLDYFGRMEELEQRLSAALGRRVEVVEEPVRKDRFQNQIDRDRVFAF